MSASKQIVARVIKDNPWMTSRCVAKDVYIPKEYHYVRSSWEQETRTEKMKAKKARKKGYEVDDYVDDEAVVPIEITETVEHKTHWSETRLHFRGKVSGNVAYAPRSSRPQKLREELADAVETPLSFVGYSYLLKKIDSQIAHFRQNDMKTPYIIPKVLVLLGLNESSEADFGETRAYARNVFYIEKYSRRQMSLTDSQDQHYELSLDEGIVEQGQIRQFILFLPSNVQFVDKDSGGILS